MTAQAEEDVEQGEHSSIAGGNASLYSHGGYQCGAIDFSPQPASRVPSLKTTPTQLFEHIEFEPVPASNSPLFMP